MAPTRRRMAIRLDGMKHFLTRGLAPDGDVQERRMDVLVDGQSVAVEVSESMTISDVLDAVKERFAGDGRIVTTLVCDGETIEPEDLDRALATAATAYGTLSVTTESPWGLGLAAMDQAGRLFSQTQGMMSEVVGSLGQGRTAEAMEIGRAHV